MSCITEEVDARHKINSELFDALMISENEKKVIEVCRKISDHALHVLTVHDDTVLHMATYFKRDDLALKLLDEIPELYIHKMTRQNKAGNTVLHATATSSRALPVADKLLRKAPGLLGMRNNNGETALFRSARYGKADIFNFLAGKIAGYDQPSKQPFLQRNDQSTVLHMAIISQHFGNFILKYYFIFFIVSFNLFAYPHPSKRTIIMLLACKGHSLTGKNPKKMEK